MNAFEELLKLTTVKIPNTNVDEITIPRPLPTPHVFSLKDGLVIFNLNAGECVSKDAFKKIAQIVAIIDRGEARLTRDGAYEMVHIPSCDEYWKVVDRELTKATYVYRDGDSLQACMIIQICNRLLRVTPEFVSVIQSGNR